MCAEPQLPGQPSQPGHPHPAGPPRTAEASYDAVVLAGGPSRRLGGADKASVRVGCRTLLDRVLAACSAAADTVVVGPRRDTYRPVRFTTEDPPDGGPLAALNAGLAHVRQPYVLLLATDLPFLTHELTGALASPPPGADGVIITDAEGRDQPLTAGYRTGPLRGALAALDAAHGGLHGLPMRLLTSRLTLRPIPADGPWDCDTWADIAAARARIGDDGRVLEEWLAAVKAELDIDPEVDITALLDAARDAAHQVIRPAAPLTTFLLGYAAAQHGTSPAEAARTIGALANSWAAEQTAATQSLRATEPRPPAEPPHTATGPGSADTSGGTAPGISAPAATSAPAAATGTATPPGRTARHREDSSG